MPAITALSVCDSLALFWNVPRFKLTEVTTWVKCVMKLRDEWFMRINATTNLEDFWQLACFVYPCWSAGWDDVSKIRTIVTNRHNTKELYVLPTQCIYVFCMDLRTNSYYFPISINWLVFITEECVYCAVRTGSLYIIQVNLGSHYAKMNITVKKKAPCNTFLLQWWSCTHQQLGHNTKRTEPQHDRLRPSR